MHKIDRQAVATPTCLIEPPERYRDLRGPDLESIRSALFIVQGQRCAYCERRTGDERNDGHIEHFRNQANHGELECDWANLFWSCSDEKTCGKYKDKCTKESGPQKKFDREDVIDPANEDPEDFLLFVSDGTVRLVEDLSEANQRRAKETLRVFQLDRSPLLRKSREDAVEPYINAIKTIFAISPDHVLTYVQSELDNLATKPFSTPIKTFLKSVTI
jgi:uncharacterized protein (TIGR02646 family)